MHIEITNIKTKTAHIAQLSFLDPDLKKVYKKPSQYRIEKFPDLKLFYILCRSEESNHEEGEEEDDLENDYNNETSSGDDSTSSDDDDAEKKPSKKLNRGINPVTGRPLWNWADEGYRRPGSKGKAKKLFHRSVSRDNETINVGDCAVFLSTARVDRPYIGKRGMP